MGYPVLTLWLTAVNLVALFAMGIDKGQARRGGRRIPEKALFLFVLLGGGLGGTAGMFLFRHKTRHWYFKFGFPLLLLLQGAALAYFLYHRPSGL